MAASVFLRYFKTFFHHQITRFFSFSNLHLFLLLIFFTLIDCKFLINFIVKYLYVTFVIKTIFFKLICTQQCVLRSCSTNYVNRRPHEKLKHWRKLTLHFYHTSVRCELKFSHLVCMWLRVAGETFQSHFFASFDFWPTKHRIVIDKTKNETAWKSVFFF